MIAKRKGVCGGREVIKGHRIPVWQIAKLYIEGASKPEIRERFPGISSEEIEEAITFFERNKERIRKQIEENKPEKALSSSAPNTHILNGEI